MPLLKSADQIMSVFVKSFLSTAFQVAILNNSLVVVYSIFYVQSGICFFYLLCFFHLLLFGLVRGICLKVQLFALGVRQEAVPG